MSNYIFLGNPGLPLGLGPKAQRFLNIMGCVGLVTIVPPVLLVLFLPFGVQNAIMWIIDKVLMVVVFGVIAFIYYVIKQEVFNHMPVRKNKKKK